VQSSSQIVTTNKPISNFLQARCPSCHPINSVKALKAKSIMLHGITHPKLIWGSFNLVFDHYRLLVTLGEGCQASHQPSDASTLTHNQSHKWTLHDAKVPVRLVTNAVLYTQCWCLVWLSCKESSTFCPLTLCYLRSVVIALFAEAFNLLLLNSISVYRETELYHIPLFFETAKLHANVIMQYL